MEFSSSDNVGISSQQEVFLKAVVPEHKHLYGFIFNERTARLKSFNYFTRDIKQYKNTLIS